MYGAKIKHLQNMRPLLGSWCTIATAKLLIFSQDMLFGKSFASFSGRSLFLNGKELGFVDQWKYLGITITTGSSFSCSSQKSLNTFYRSANSVLNVTRRPSECVQMKILYNISVPHLTYACDVVDFSAKEMNRLHVALNDAIRKVFTFSRWESVKALRECFGYLSVTEIFAKRKRSFLQKIPSTGNQLLSLLLDLE